MGMEISFLKEDARSETATRRLSELSKKIMDLAEGLHQASRQLHPAVVEDLVVS